MLLVFSPLGVIFDRNVAVRTAPFADEPLIEACSVECVATARDNFHPLPLTKVGKTDRARLVFKRVSSTTVVSWCHRTHLSQRW